MINRVELKNFGPIEQLDWQNLGKINLVIGNNDCGKSFLLKALYSAMRTIEEYKRGDNPEDILHILKSKLHWTFQAEYIEDIITQKKDELSFKLNFKGEEFTYSFNKRKMTSNFLEPRIDNSIFLPAKEVLSLHNIILTSRVRDKLFGFDDTYLDLANALQLPQKYGFYDGSSRHDGKMFYCDVTIGEAISQVKDMIGGRIELDNTNKRWYFKKDNQRFPMGTTAEGIKKIGILDTLLSNGYLNENSIVFIDEPEANLHPEMISKLLDIIAILAQHGIQFFIASHSYFVIKKLFLIAQEQQMSIPVLSYQDNEWVQSDLKEEVPNNPIIDESIRLYEQEVDLVFK